MSALTAAAPPGVQPPAAASIDPTEAIRTLADDEGVIPVLLLVWSRLSTHNTGWVGPAAATTADRSALLAAPAATTTRSGWAAIPVLTWPARVAPGTAVTEAI